jgi:hypothetical protein
MKLDLGEIQHALQLMMILQDKIMEKHLIIFERSDLYVKQHCRKCYLIGKHLSNQSKIITIEFINGYINNIRIQEVGKFYLNDNSIENIMELIDFKMSLFDKESLEREELIYEFREEFKKNKKGSVV